MEYTSVRQVAERWGVTPRRVQVLCREGRIPGAQLVSNAYIIPADAAKPVPPARPSSDCREPAAAKLIHGDCLEHMGRLEDGTVNLILTDPPYNLGNFMRDRQTNLAAMRDNYFGKAGWDDLEYDSWVRLMEEFFREAARVTTKGGSMVMFMSIIKIETIITLAQSAGFYYKTTGIWHKLNPMPRNMNLHYVNSTEAWAYFTYGKKTGTFNNHGIALHDFVESPVASSSERRHGPHPTQKPVELLRGFVRTLSDCGDLVLDPFMGSGSAGVAAVSEHRRFVGIELSETYFGNAQRRIAEVAVRTLEA